MAVVGITKKISGYEMPMDQSPEKSGFQQERLPAGEVGQTPFSASGELNARISLRNVE